MKMNDIQMNDYLEAEAHLKAALALLNKIGTENQRDYDADYYASQVAGMLSSDEGECGLSVYLKKVAA